MSTARLNVEGAVLPASAWIEPAMEHESQDSYRGMDSREFDPHAYLVEYFLHTLHMTQSRSLRQCSGTSAFTPVHSPPHSHS